MVKLKQICEERWMQLLSSVIYDITVIYDGFRSRLFNVNPLSNFINIHIISLLHSTFTQLSSGMLVAPKELEFEM